jgi:hypothetical protein
LTSAASHHRGRLWTAAGVDGAIRRLNRTLKTALP